MKSSTLLVCMMVVLVAGVAQAKNHEVAQFQDLLTIITNVVGSVVSAVMTPILQVVAIIQETIIAPIQNQVTSTGLGFAVEQFCNLVVVPNFPSPKCCQRLHHRRQGGDPQGLRCWLVRARQLNRLVISTDLSD